MIAELPRCENRAQFAIRADHFSPPTTQPPQVLPSSSLQSKATSLLDQLHKHFIENTQYTV